MEKSHPAIEGRIAELVYTLRWQSSEGELTPSANCNSSPSQQWSYGVQSGPQIKLAGTDKCLDAGRNPSPGSKLRVSRCDGSSGQTWFVANTGLWILNDRDSNYLCADITGGSRAEGTPLQLWPCAQGNYNQQFYPGFCYSNSCIM